MKIVVGVKHVPDTETKIKIDGLAIDESGVKWGPSPYDEFAVEEALQLRDAAGGGEVILVTMGRPDAQASLRKALAMGADRAIHVADPTLDAADGLTRARLLAEICQREEAELLLVGKYGVGLDEGQTGPMTAELLSWAHSAAVGKLELADGKYTAHREVEGAVEIQQGSLPAVITCEKGLNKPRLASLKGIMQAKKKPLETLSIADLGVEELSTHVVLEALELPPPRAAGKIVEGDAAAAADELARLLREEAKVI